MKKIIATLLDENILYQFLKDNLGKDKIKLVLYSLVFGLTAIGVLFFISADPAGWGFSEVIRVLVFFLVLTLLAFSRFKLIETLTVGIYKSLKDLKLDITEALLGIKPPLLEDKQELPKQISTFLESAGRLAEPLIRVLSAIPLLVFILLYLLFTNLVVFLLTLTVSIIVLVLRVREQSKLKDIHQRVKDLESEFEGMMDQGPGAFLNLKLSSANYQAYTSKVVDSSEDLLSEQISGSLGFFQNRLFGETVMLASFGAASLLLTVTAGAIQPDVVKAGVCLLFYYLNFFIVLQNADKLEVLRHYLSELFEIKKELKNVAEKIGSDPLPEAGKEPVTVTITFDDETVSFEAGKAYLFNKTGENDKKTKLKILAGLIQDENNNLLYNNTPLSDNNLLTYRKKTVYLTAQSAIEYNFPFGNEMVEDIQGLFGLLGAEKQLRSAGNALDISHWDDTLRQHASLLECIAPEKEIFIFENWQAGKPDILKDLFFSRILNKLKSRGIVIVYAPGEEKNKHFDSVIG